MFPEQCHLNVLMQDKTYSSRWKWVSKHCREAEIPVRKLSKSSPFRQRKLLLLRWISVHQSLWLAIVFRRGEAMDHAPQHHAGYWSDRTHRAQKKRVGWEGNTATQIWNLLAFNNNKTNRGAGAVQHGNNNERELDMQENKTTRDKFPGHSIYSSISLYTLMCNEREKAEGAPERAWVSLPSKCLHITNLAAFLLITAH